jgi:hypothetical protein
LSEKSEKQLFNFLKGRVSQTPPSSA